MKNNSNISRLIRERDNITKLISERTAVLNDLNTKHAGNISIYKECFVKSLFNRSNELKESVMLFQARLLAINNELELCYKVKV